MPLAARTNRGCTFTKRNKMNSKKFLDQLGLIALISKIKQALSGKQDVDMIVTIAKSGNAYSCDTSIADIVAAHDAGRDVYAVLPPVSGGSSTKIKLVDVQNYGSGTVMMVSFGDIINNGINNVLYSVSGTRQNNLDAWSVSQKTMQEKLVSGTSIKTVNGNTLLGSGDVTINGSERVTATWNASTSAYVSGASVDNMYQSFYTDGKVLELHLVNGNYNGMVLTCHGGYTDGSVRHMKFSGVTDDWIVSCDVVGTAVTLTYTSLFDIYEELNGKQDTIGLNNKVDADLVEYRGTDTTRLGNGDSMTEALQTLDRAITNLGTPNEIASITTQESSASGGNNVVTITDTDGTSTSFNVKNGKDGKDGADGADGVSLGEIALVQTTGDATDEVMSQKAVSLKVDRLDALELLDINIMAARLPDGYEPLEYIDNSLGATLNTGIVLKDTDCKLLGQWKRVGTCTTTGATIIGYDAFNNYRAYGLYYTQGDGSEILAKACTNSRNGETIAIDTNNEDWHYFSLEWGKLMLDGVDYELPMVTSGGLSPDSATIKTWSTMPMHIGIIAMYKGVEAIAVLVPCRHGDSVGMYDVARDVFISSSNNKAFVAGPDALSPSDKLVSAGGLTTLVSQDTGDNKSLLMSQDAITRELALNNESRPITYFHGTLANIALADYPEFDFRSADGISIVLADDSGYNSNIPIIGVNNYTPSGYGFGQDHFAMFGVAGSLRMGRMTSYGTVLRAGGYNFGSYVNYRHIVVTYDFNTGESKFYANGVLKSTQTTEDFDRQTLVQDCFNTCTRMYASSPSVNAVQKTTGIAVFCNVLTDSDVEDLYGSGSDSIKNTLIPSKWKASFLHPTYWTNWNVRFGAASYGVAVHEQDGSITLTPASGKKEIIFGFVGLSGLHGNLIYEWDFEVTSGSYTHSSGANMCMLIAGNWSWCFEIYDSNGNNVRLTSFGVGTYHVVCKPNNVLIGGINYSSNINLAYYFRQVSTDFSMNIKPTLKITERGAALEFSLQTYKGLYWEQTNGIKLTTSPDIYYGTTSFGVGRDSFVSDTVIYKSSVLPQFNGQIAVDSTNGKVYIGYLTGTGGTWKQINNS